MVTNPFKRQGFRLSAGELFAVHAVYSEVENGQLKVGGPIMRHWYRHMAGVIRRGFEEELANNPLDESVVSSEITIGLNRASGKMLEKSVNTAIDHYSDTSTESSLSVFSEDLNILRGLSSALASRE